MELSDEEKQRFIDYLKDEAPANRRLAARVTHEGDQSVFGEALRKSLEMLADGQDVVRAALVSELVLNEVMNAR